MKVYCVKDGNRYTCYVDGDEHRIDKVVLVRETMRIVLLNEKIWLYAKGVTVTEDHGTATLTVYMD